ncbi:MAG: hypothetical protein JXM79_26065 [Sedimentisphaerales bacterium]|nr:hypothetical protein [Sedimentisphaerales bacterium]
MENDVDRIEEMWRQQAISPTVIGTTVENWDRLPPSLQATIEAEARRRGLWEKVCHTKADKDGDVVRQTVKQIEPNLSGRKVKVSTKWPKIVTAMCAIGIEIYIVMSLLYGVFSWNTFLIKLVTYGFWPIVFWGIWVLVCFTSGSKKQVVNQAKASKGQVKWLHTRLFQSGEGLPQDSDGSEPSVEQISVVQNTCKPETTCDVMNNQQEDEDQLTKKRPRFVGIVSSVTMCCIIMFCAKYIGRQVGGQAAIHTVQQESITQNAPTGFMGAKWLMSTSQVKSLFPDAFEFAPGRLMLHTTAFGRPAFVGFDFTDNRLLMIIISFKGEKTESTYQKTHYLIEEQYGAFSEPSSTSEQTLSSEKIIGRIAIEHLLYQQIGMPIEQVLIYRTKSSSAY